MIDQTNREANPDRSATNEFWFNLKTGEVEVGKQSIALYRVGPFETFEDAENALETIAERSAAWQDEDEEY